MTATTDLFLDFFVEGKPVPKARPRVTRSGHTYTPARTVAWEQTIAWTAKAAMKGRAPIEGPVVAVLTFFGARANSDLDNLCKAALDALSGVVFQDDKQVDLVTAERVRGSEHPAGVRISVEALR